MTVTEQPADVLRVNQIQQHHRERDDRDALPFLVFRCLLLPKKPISLCPSSSNAHFSKEVARES